MATNIFANIDILSDLPFLGLGIEFQCQSLTDITPPHHALIEDLEFAEKYERLKALVAEAKEATSVAHVNLMSASARYLDERRSFFYLVHPKAIRSELYYDQTVKDEEKLRRLTEDFDLKKTEAMKDEEKYERHEAQLAEVEEATSVANVSLKAIGDNYLKEQKKVYKV
ncbi:hypothetical protein FH972_016762 [Carpinus fangiana]|uniref:Uncharacterized protein n=1 Tax=Carpinus fangiana TaxID=176857 RepID=A0A5N6RKC0_9ROSI|nr:hypothetical protein FH972_016762 [Carpinus fangiana]